VQQRDALEGVNGRKKGLTTVKWYAVQMDWHSKSAEEKAGLQAEGKAAFAASPEGKWQAYEASISPPAHDGGEEDAVDGHLPD
jgi:hypothetical protein